jgi:hypothetical protein
VFSSSVIESLSLSITTISGSKMFSTVVAIMSVKGRREKTIYRH